MNKVEEKYFLEFQKILQPNEKLITFIYLTKLTRASNFLAFFTSFLNLFSSITSLILGVTNKNLILIKHTPFSEKLTLDKIIPLGNLEAIILRKNFASKQLLVKIKEQTVDSYQLSEQNLDPFLEQMSLTNYFREEPFKPFSIKELFKIISTSAIGVIIIVFLGSNIKNLNIVQYQFQFYALLIVLMSVISSEIVSKNRRLAGVFCSTLIGVWFSSYLLVGEIIKSTEDVGFKIIMSILIMSVITSVCFAIGFLSMIFWGKITKRDEDELYL